MVGTCECGNEPLGSIKCGEYIVLCINSLRHSAKYQVSWSPKRDTNPGPAELEAEHR